MTTNCDYGWCVTHETADGGLVHVGPIGNLGVVIAKPEGEPARISSPSRRRFSLPETRQLAADLREAAELANGLES